MLNAPTPVAIGVGLGMNAAALGMNVAAAGFLFASAFDGHEFRTTGHVGRGTSNLDVRQPSMVRTLILCRKSHSGRPSTGRFEGLLGWVAP